MSGGTEIEVSTGDSVAEAEDAERSKLDHFLELVFGACDLLS